MLIAQEGRWPIAVLVAAALVVGIAVDWPTSSFVWGAAALVAMVFRQTPRPVNASPLAVLSPADARVETTGAAHDPFLDRQALRIALRQDWFGPYVMYAPTEGKLQRIWSTARTVALLIHTDEGDDLVLEVERSRLIRYLHCTVSTGERMRQGGACGFAGFGRRMNLYLPADSRLEVASGARLQAGRSLAQLLHRAAEKP